MEAKVAYCANLVLKINVKLGGVNSFLEPATELPVIGDSDISTVIFGGDVTHPSPGSNGCSIASLVGSIDDR